MLIAIHKSKNPLSWRAGRKGISRQDAVARAEENLHSIREAGVAEIDNMLILLQKASDEYISSRETAGRALYDISNRLGSICATFGFPGLGAVAYRLCDLLSRFDSGVPVNIEALSAHVGSMLIIRQQPLMGRDAEALILGQLDRLIEHLVAKSSFAA